MSTSSAIAKRQEATITELPRNDPGAVMEAVITRGDLSDLRPDERARYYVAVCESVGLNPLTRPFLYVKFQDGGLQLYPRKEAADQLRAIHKVQTRIVDQRVESGIFLVTIEARHPDGRVETDIGAVPVAGQNGLMLANAMKKAITQGKRRVTLAMLGLSLIDDDEIRAIPGARFIEPDDAGQPGVPVTIAEAPRDRAAEAQALMRTVQAAYNLTGKPPKMTADTAENLVCWRYGLDNAKLATAEQLAETRETVERWQRGKWADDGLARLGQIAGCDTEEMLIACDTAFRDEQVDDPFLVAALAERLADLQMGRDGVTV